MDQQLLQRTRYLLQTRFRRMRTAPVGNFEVVCQQVLDWLERHPILGGILRHLDNVPGDHHQEIQLMLQSPNIGGARYHVIGIQQRERQDQEPAFKGYTPRNDEEHAAACLQIIRAAIQIPKLEFYSMLAVYLTRESISYRGNTDDNDRVISPIKEIAMRDLYEYLDEQLDGINAVNGLLRKYKQNVEWFQWERIQQIILNGYGGKTGERALALHLQQYIFDQGVEFSVEPSSASGEVDLLLRDPSGLYSIIDAKYIRPNAPPSEVTKKIAEGFNQVARYCSDYNQSEGFLAIFVNDDISILLEVEENDTFKYFKIGGYTIYYIEVNISERPSASRSGKAKQLHITKDQLFEKFEELSMERKS